MRRNAHALIAGLSVLALCAGAAAAQTSTAGSSQILGNQVGGGTSPGNLQTTSGNVSQTGPGGSNAGVNPNNPAGGVSGLGGSSTGVDPNNPAGALSTLSGGGTTDALGTALSVSVLGDSTSGNGLPVPTGANPADWHLKEGVGDPLVLAGDLALKSRGYQGGLAAQGVDPGQITSPLEFKEAMPTSAAAQASSAMGMLTSMLGVK